MVHRAAMIRAPCIGSSRSRSLAIGVLAACNDQPLRAPGADAGPTAGGLTPSRRRRCSPRSATSTITLGDYAAALEHMDQFDRLRYQSPERRKELLDEMIDVELLADEATATGLRQGARDAAGAPRRSCATRCSPRRARASPAPADIPDAEVRAYYDAHNDDFREPERRRVSAIVVDDRGDARRGARGRAQEHDAARVGRARRRSTRSTAPKPAQAERAGRSRGRPRHRRPAGRPARRRTRACPSAVRAAVFEIDERRRRRSTRVVEARGQVLRRPADGRRPTRTSARSRRRSARSA